MTIFFRRTVHDQRERARRLGAAFDQVVLVDFDPADLERWLAEADHIYSVGIWKMIERAMLSRQREKVE